MIKVKSINNTYDGGRPVSTAGEVYDAWLEDGCLWIQNDKGEKEWIAKKHINNNWFERNFELPNGMTLEDVWKMREGKTTAIDDYDRAMGIL